MVDLAQQVFWFGRTLSDRRLGRTTKNRSQDPMPIVEEFAHYLATVTLGIGQAPVFVNPEADRSRNPSGFYHVDFLARLWAEAIEMTSLEPIPLKNIRHSTAMYLLNIKGLAEDMVRRILRHSSPQYLDAYTRHETTTIAAALVKKVRRLPSRKRR